MSDSDDSSEDARRRAAVLVRDRLAQLPYALAETVRLTYFSRLDNREIGLRTGMTDREVRSALSAGLLQLGRLPQGV